MPAPFVYPEDSLRKEIQDGQKQLNQRLVGATTSLPNNSSVPTVPLIDLAPSFDRTISSRQSVAAQIRAACLTTGFFQISNHGVPLDNCAAILDQARCFYHDLNREQKEALHVRHNSLFRGWEPPDYTDVYAGGDGELGGGGKETKEGFNWGYEDALDPGANDGLYVELDGKKPGPGHENVWPSEELLPGFHAAVKAYYGQILQLARHLFRLFALSLELEEGYFDSMLTHPGGIGRLLWYPAQEDASSSAADEEPRLGLGAHTDYECFTLLLSSSSPGLEILFPPSAERPQPTWVPCPVRAGVLTVNVADFLMRWTNGRYKSTVHRVVNRSQTEERYSVPVFLSINYDAEVETLPGCEEGDREGGYRPVRAGEYVLERLRATTTKA